MEILTAHGSAMDSRALTVIMTEEDLSQVLEYCEINQERFICHLKRAVSFANVSTWKDDPKTFQEMTKMIEYAERYMKELGFQVELHQVHGKSEDGKSNAIPPVIFGTLGNDEKKRTILIYGHLDVQPAKLSDGWDTDPFTLTNKDGKLFGRGATDDKGPVFSWFHAIEAYNQCKVGLPVNIKMVLESMEEVGSDGLETLLKSEKGKKFLQGVSAVVISDNYWVGKEQPCLTYGLRGLLYYHIAVDGGTKDLHSGVYGGAIHEPMWDLTWLMGKLVDQTGKILIPGINDGVLPLTEEETQQYQSIQFDLEEFRKDTGVHKIRFPDCKDDTLMHRWRYPSLSLHGIEGDFSDAGSKTVIPRRVTGKFSIRLVPNQDPAVIDGHVRKYLSSLWEGAASTNKFFLLTDNAGRPWMETIHHWNYRAASNAVKRVYNQDPQYTREGGSIPVAILLGELTSANVLLLPIGQSDDGAHSQNEKISIQNYINGTKVMAAYFWDVGRLNEVLN